MPPVSYQGPTQGDEEPERTYSQTEQTNLGSDQSGRSVSAIVGRKGQNVYTIAPETTVLEAVGELNRFQIGALVVVAADGKLLGIMSERDIIRNIESMGLELFGRPVSDVMTPDPVTCGPDDTVEHIMKEMTRNRFRHLPVMQNDRLCGLVSIRDIMHHRLDELEYENLKIKQAIIG